MAQTTRIVTHSPEQTFALGERLGAQLKRGDILLLHGDLGAGKSLLARGIGRGMGITQPIASPTFTLLLIYDEARIPLYHFDLYRLSDPDEFYALGFDEYLGADGVAVIEWPERCALEPPRHARVYRIYMEVTDETERALTCEAINCALPAALEGEE